MRMNIRWVCINVYMYTYECVVCAWNAIDDRIAVKMCELNDRN